MPKIKLRLRRPHAAQQKVIDEAKRFSVLSCGRRWGKTALGIHQLIRAALDGEPVGWFAPSYKMLAEAWREVASHQDCRFLIHAKRSIARYATQAKNNARSFARAAWVWLSAIQAAIE